MATWQIQTATSADASLQSYIKDTVMASKDEVLISFFLSFFLLSDVTSLKSSHGFTVAKRFADK